MENNPIDPRGVISTLFGVISPDAITLLDDCLYKDEAELRNSRLATDYKAKEKGTLFYDVSNQKFDKKSCFVTAVEQIYNNYRFITYFIY